MSIIMKEKKFLELAYRVRPMYHFNNEYLYWLVPCTGPLYADSFCTAPVMSDCSEQQSFLGIREHAMRRVGTFTFYSSKPWFVFRFNLYELFQQIPDNWIEPDEDYAFEFDLANRESSYDETRGVYYAPVTFYRVEGGLPKVIKERYPLVRAEE